MRYLRFKAIEDQEFGGLGLVSAKKHKFCNGMFTAQNGLILAHDIIEHQQGMDAIGTIGDEMLALGAVLVTRGQYDEIGNAGTRATTAEHIASDIVNMGRLYMENGVPMRQALQGTRFDLFDHMIADAIDCARDQLPSELEEEIDDGLLETYLEETRVLIKRGVYLAHKRFGTGITANRMFNNIQSAVEPYCNMLEFEGQEFRLAYDSSVAYFEEVYEDSGDY